MSFPIYRVLNRSTATECTDFDVGLYTFAELDDLITNQSYIPVASAAELRNLNFDGSQTLGAGTCWEDSYTTTADNIGLKFVQVRNIDFTGEASWTSAINIDTATYDGNELDIDNLTGTAEILRPSGSGGTTTVKNVRVSSATITGSARTILIGQVRGGTYTNNIVGGSITSSLGCSGVLHMSGAASSAVSISDCHFNGTVSGGGDFCGGIITSSTGTASFGVTIDKCTSSGSVSTTAYSGGIGGVSTYTDVTECYSSADCDSSNWIAGGIFARANVVSSFLDCYADGNIETTNGRSGGLIGQTVGSTETVDNCYAACTFTGSTTFRGGLIGANFSGSPTVTDSYWDTDIGPATSAGGGTGKTTSELQTPTTATGIYVNWDDTIWDFGTTSQYPTLI